ncbi:MAG: short-chain dehydrogenase/reductase [Marmoricola sp.]|nr:short-chain dehydrogenase/reductase [Marmoricola sp.]
MTSFADISVATPPAVGGDIQFDFTGKRVWVTGASRGLGRAIAEAHSRAGARVALTARTEESLLDVAEGIRKHGTEPLIVSADVADAAAVRRCVSKIESAWGGLDVLVNCAGISPVFQRAESIEDDIWRSVLDVNVTGTFNCATAAVRLMSRGASVVNISSIHGQVGMERMAAYSTSKGAVDALSRTLALEWSERGVRVNVVSPGYVETDMTEGLRGHPKWRQYLLDRVPVGHFATTDDIVGSVLFLSSSAGRYMTGTNVVIDGGWTAS